MATGLSGSFELTGTKGMTAKVFWAEEYDVGTNTSVVKIMDIQFKSASYKYTYYLKGSTTIENATVLTCKSNIPTHRVNVSATGKYYSIVANSGYASAPWAGGSITHNTDGSKSITIALDMYGYTVSGGGNNGWRVNGSVTIDLTTIPRATQPTLYSNSVDMGNTATIYLYRADESFKHDLYYSFAGSAYTLIASDLDTVYYWAVPDLASEIPNSTSGTVTIKCNTKKSGTVIGTKTVLLTAKVPASVVPTISSVTVSEATEGVAAQFQGFVKDKSTLSVSVAAAGAKGSTIKSYSTTILGDIHDTASFTTDSITEAGEVKLVTVVTDTRGRTAELETIITVLDYKTPVTTEFKAYRVNLDGEAKNDGEYLSVAYAYEVAPVENLNIAHAVIEYKRSSAADWSTTPLLEMYDLNGSGVVQFEQEFTSDYQYDIRLTVTDWFGESASYTATLPTAKVIFDIKANGNGMAFGKTAEFDGLEVLMPPGAESMFMVGVRAYELGDGYGYILYNNGLLMQWGTVAITPTAVNTSTALQVNFPIAYKVRPHITGTVLANSPNAVSWGMGVGTTEEAGLTGLVIYMTRTTLHATTFRWMAVGQVDPQKWSD